jgi:hypothetical protein
VGTTSPKQMNKLAAEAARRAAVFQMRGLNSRSQGVCYPLLLPPSMNIRAPRFPYSAGVSPLCGYSATEAQSIRSGPRWEANFSTELSHAVRGVSCPHAVHPLVGRNVPRSVSRSQRRTNYRAASKGQSENPKQRRRRNLSLVRPGHRRTTTELARRKGSRMHFGNNSCRP